MPRPPHALALLLLAPPIAAACGDDGSTTGATPTCFEPVALSGSALTLIERPLDRDPSGCNGLLRLAAPLTVSLSAPAAVEVTLDGAAVPASPARVPLPAGEHSVRVTGGDDVAALRIDARPDPPDARPVDCGGTLVLRADRDEAVPVDLRVPGDGRCALDFLAETPLPDLRVESFARVAVRYRVDGADTTLPAPLAVEAGSHRLELEITDPLGEQIVPLQLVVGAP